MERVIAMIPARLGSKRISKKNIRLINGKPLIAYIIEAAINSKVFDDIYINSESEIMEDIAKEYGVKFYKRPESLSLDTSTNDEFVLDFLEKNNCNILIQLLATSPFLTSEDIFNFVSKMKNESLDTLISVKNEQIECVYNKLPINFNQKGQTLPSQQLTPIQVYACGIMGWSVNNYKDNMFKYGSGYHGGDGKIDFFPLKGYSTIDIDNEEDFRVAEVIFKSLSIASKEPEYYTANKKETIENSVPSILYKDGVQKNDLFDFNKEQVNIEEIIKANSKTVSWSKRIVNSENNSATLICQMPGEGNRKHYHDTWNEWWYIIDGEWEWELEDKKIIVKKDDVVFIEKGKKHKITAIGNKPAIRLAVSREDVNHIYDEHQ